MHRLETDADITVHGFEIETIAKANESLKRGGLRLLRFPETLESAFKEFYYTNTLKHVRIALLTGMFLFALFGLVDMQLLPADRNHMWFIRYVVVCPVITAGLAFTYLHRLRQFMQPVLWSVMLTGSLGIVAMVYFDPLPAKNYYYSGILLLVMGAFTFVSLRFYYAVIWAVTTVLAYELVANFATRTDVNNIVQNTFSIVATVIIGSFSNCLMENYLRRDFLNTILLEHENRQLQRASEELRDLSISDALTTLGNRRHFDLMLDQEWMRGMRSATPISLVLIDIDYFKNYNDSYGHQAGDECIRLVAQKVRGVAKRPGDTSARYGGEEFALLLADTDAADAVTIAEICRECVQSLHIPHMQSTVCDVVTISAGVATIVPNGETSRKALIEAADKALYRAKSGGRNRVVQENCMTAERSLHLVHVQM